LKEHLHLRLTLESSAKQQIEARAEAEERSIASYVRRLIEKEHAREPQEPPK